MKDKQIALSQDGPSPGWVTTWISQNCHKWVLIRWHDQTYQVSPTGDMLAYSTQMRLQMWWIPIAFRRYRIYELQAHARNKVAPQPYSSTPSMHQLKRMPPTHPSPCKHNQSLQRTKSSLLYQHINCLPSCKKKTKTEQEHSQNIANIIQTIRETAGRNCKN